MFNPNNFSNLTKKKTNPLYKVAIFVFITLVAWFLFKFGFLLYINHIIKSNDLYGEKEKTYEYSDNSDLDGDGLYYAEEIEYGTNPNSRDTDNDGFMDTDEIFNGFNPLGEGGLPQSIKDTLPSKDINICKEPGKYFSSCVTRIAFYERDYSYCEIPDVFKPKCYPEIASIKKDKKQCLNIENRVSRNECLINIAKYSLDYSVCPTLEDEYFINNCKLEVAVAKNDSAYCEKFENSSYLGSCLSRIAVLTDDIKMCLSAPGLYISSCLDVLRAKFKDNADIKEYDKNLDERHQSYRDDLRQKENERDENFRKNFFSYLSPSIIIITIIATIILSLIAIFVQTVVYSSAIKNIGINDAKTIKKSFIISLIFTSIIVLTFLIFFIFSIFNLSSISLFISFPLTISLPYLFYTLFKKYFNLSIKQIASIFIYSITIFLIVSFITSLIVGFILIKLLELSGFRGIAF